jgi:hypothetical protein
MPMKNKKLAILRNKISSDKKSKIEEVKDFNKSKVERLEISPKSMIQIESQGY